MRSLQNQYNLIKEGKSSKDVFLKSAKSLFPNYIPSHYGFNETVNILKEKSIISESLGGVVTKGNQDPDWFKIFNENITEAKAEEKKPTKEVVDTETKAFDYKDSKNIDNIYGPSFLKGFYTEMCNPKNEGKTVDELKEIVAKNLNKNLTYYTENGQFGLDGVGYTTEHPGLGTPKEAKGKYKSSGYGDLNENKSPKFNDDDDTGLSYNFEIGEDSDYGKVIDRKEVGDKLHVTFENGDIYEFEKDWDKWVELRKLNESYDDEYEQEFGSEDDEDILLFSDGERTVELYKSGNKWVEGSVEGEAPYGWGSKTYQSYLTSNDILDHLRSDYGGSWRRVMYESNLKESYGSSNDFEGTGLRVYGKTTEDNQLIDQAIEETIFYGIFNEHKNYWFFPEAKETIGRLENELETIFKKKGINVRFKRQFNESLKEQNLRSVIQQIIKEELNEDENPCWDGYEMIGMKDKDGKQVPNCVPKNENMIKLKDLLEAEYYETFKAKEKKERKKPATKKAKTSDKIKAIETQGSIAALEAKIEALEEEITNRETKMKMATENEDFAEFVNEKKIKMMEKEVKQLQKAQEKYIKEYKKYTGEDYQAKKEIVDETEEMEY